MDITFKDIKRQRRWSYTGVDHIDISPHYIGIRGCDPLTNKDYSFVHGIDEFDSIELEKSEDET